MSATDGKRSVEGPRRVRHQGVFLDALQPTSVGGLHRRRLDSTLDVADVARPEKAGDGGVSDSLRDIYLSHAYHVSGRSRAGCKGVWLKVPQREKSRLC